MRRSGLKLRGRGALASTALALAGAAAIGEWRRREAERRFPPRGHFIEAGGVRLHVIERGTGRPVLLLHGNGGMTSDLEISGLVDRLSPAMRCVVPDRLGFGYSERPRGRDWTARAQAGLLPFLLDRLGIDRATVFAHSWGTLVALALALDHPDRVDGLVLASGYYFPTARADGIAARALAAPGVGDALAHTAGPLVAEFAVPGMIETLFAPQSVTERFAREFPVALTARPSQIRAFSQETAGMSDSAAELAPRYRDIGCPVAILGGDADRIVDFAQQSLALHETIPGSTLDRFAGAGHMIHHLDPDRIGRAIETLTRAAPTAIPAEVGA